MVVAINFFLTYLSPSEQDDIIKYRALNCFRIMSPSLAYISSFDKSNI